MNSDGNTITRDVDLPSVIGLLCGESEQTVETLTIGAIKRHRKLVGRAERMFQDVHENGVKKEPQPTDAYIGYLAATIEMHAQMSALTTLLTILGRTPKV